MKTKKLLLTLLAVLLPLTSFADTWHQDSLFLVSANTTTGLDYEFDNAVELCYDDWIGAYLATAGTPGDEASWVNKVMISIVRGNNVTFIKPFGNYIGFDESYNTNWGGYTESGYTEIYLPAVGVWVIYVDTDNKLINMEQIEGEVVIPPIEINPNPTEVVLHGGDQFFIVSDRTLSAGETTVVQFKYKSSVNAIVTTQCHATPGNYLYWDAIGNVNFVAGDDWQEFKTTFTVPSEADGMQTIAFFWAGAKDISDYYFKDFVWKLEDDTETLIDEKGARNFYVKEAAGPAPHIFGTLTLIVTDENGVDLTDKVSITWYDANGKEIGMGKRLNGIEEETELYYTVELDEELGNVYREAKMRKVVANREALIGQSEIICQLEKIGRVMMEGRVSATDIDKNSMTVNVKQMLNGKWEQNYTTHTDEQGVFRLEVYDDETDITISGDSYINTTIHRNGFNGNGNVGIIPVSLISGFSIAANITMQVVINASERYIETWTGNLNDIDFTLNNKTKGKTITDFTVQNGNVIIRTGAAIGDEIALTAKSKQGIFANATTTFTIEEGANAFDLHLTELGGVDATCAASANGSTSGYLYNSAGLLVAKGSYTGDTLSLRHLPSGNYTLVSMGNSMLLGSMTRFSDIAATGLKEGTDYEKTDVKVTDGELTAVSVSEIPHMDDTRFYYTSSDTYFSANKASVTVGNYLTLQAHVDFKPEYTAKVDNVTLIIDLPEGCQMVENSVIANRQAVPHTVNGNRLTMTLNKEQYGNQVRFCIIPTLNQDYTVTAMAQFDIDSQVTQPIGTAQFEAKGLSLSTIEKTVNTNITVNGTAKSHSEVSIYDNDVLIGKTSSKADGSWTAECELFRSYSHSFHDIYAKITTETGMELTSETRQVEYDKNYLVPEKVTMLYFNPEFNKNYNIVFDLINGTTTPSSYYYFPYKNYFTFLADFTRNDSTVIKNVNIKVLNSDGTVRTLPATFDGKQNKWVATTKYESANRLPQNVAVEYDKELMFSDEDREEILGEEANILVSCAHDIYNFFTDKVAMTLVEDSEDYVVFECKTGEETMPFYYRIENMEYSVAEEMMNTNQFAFTENADGFVGTFIEITNNGITVYVVDITNSSAFKLMLYGSLATTREKISSTYPIVNAVEELEEYVYSGKFLDNVLKYSGYLLELISGIKEYWSVKGDFVNMCETIINYSELLLKAKEKTYTYILAKCPDGSYKLSHEKRAQYSNAVQAMDPQIAEFENQCYMYLEEYKNKLMASVGTFIGTLGLGRVIDKIGKSGKFINSELNEKVNEIFNKHFPSIVESETTASILSSLLGTTAIFVQDQIEKIFDYKDFNSVRDNMLYWSSKECSQFLQTYKNLQNGMIQKYIKCGNNENIDEVKDNKDDFRGNGSTGILDPSGYVYEAVLSNRLEGVTATCYQKVIGEDMYGDPTEEAVVWNAADYSQVNPQLTDATGFYRWDVPQGMWQVKYEKEGYETAYSEWLPVPPPQLDVNIGMKQSTPPTVKQMRGYESGITIDMNKYMLPNTMTTQNITVTHKGAAVNGSMEMLNAEKAPLSGETYVQKVKFVPQSRFHVGDEVTVTVKKDVKSYCNVTMTQNHVQTVKIASEIDTIAVAEEVAVPYRSAYDLYVQVLPEAASVGKKLRVSTSSEMIASLNDKEVTIGESGWAVVRVNGDLPGGAVLTFSIDGYDITATTKVRVKSYQKGDVNHDNTIDVADIAQIIDLMAGCECIPSDEADVNSDGVVDVADIATIISIMAGMR